MPRKMEDVGSLAPPGVGSDVSAIAGWESAFRLVVIGWNNEREASAPIMREGKRSLLERLNMEDLRDRALL